MTPSPLSVVHRLLHRPHPKTARRRSSAKVPRRRVKQPAAQTTVKRAPVPPISPPSPPPRSPRIRLILVWGILMLSMMGLLARLAYLQLDQGEALTQIARQQQSVQRFPRQTRHPIVDRQGNVLAVDRMVYTLYAHPLIFNQPRPAVAEALGPLLEVPPEELAQKFNQQDTGIRLAMDLPEETADRVRALRVDGLELTPRQQRFYPQQGLFAPIVGFVNLDGEPQAGLEMALADQLEIPQEKKPESDSSRLPLPASQLNLQLTLDSRLQRVAQQELQNTVAQHRAQRGTALVMDAHTGAILAFAVVPTYDPNRYFEADLTAFRNWAVSDLYEPGSTFKPINIAIALELGAIKADDMVADSGQIQIDKWTIRNADYASRGGRGPISITDVLKYSSNVGMVRIMNQIRSSTYFDWLQRIGLGKPTGIDLPAEVSGQLKDREQFVNSIVESATTSFGQGFSLTPVQLLQLEGMLANGGKLVTPHVVKGLVDNQGTVQWQPPRPQERTIFSPETAQQVVTMLEEVVEDGTGQTAKLPGYRIGGKTGTAQKATNAGVYGKGRITSFVGILPVNEPKYVVLAIIDEPKGDNAYGSTVAAPLVKTITESLVVIEGIPPTTAATSPQ